MKTQTQTQAKKTATKTAKGATKPTTPKVDAKVSSAKASAKPSAKAIKGDSKQVNGKRGAEVSSAQEGAPKVDSKALLAVVAHAVAGVAKRVADKSKYYKSAISYHLKQKTVFPRPMRDADRAALTIASVDAVFSKHDKRILSSGDGDGQAVFDCYMMSLKK